MGQPRSLFRLSSFFSNTHHYYFYSKYMLNNFHPVYGAGIWTHDLQNVGLLPLPLDQGSLVRKGLKIIRVYYCSSSVTWAWLSHKGFMVKKIKHWFKKEFLGVNVIGKFLSGITMLCWLVKRSHTAWNIQSESTISL